MEVEKNELEHPLIVWYGIQNEYAKLRKNYSFLLSCRQLSDDGVDIEKYATLNIAMAAVKEQLVLFLVKLFDNARHKNRFNETPNCSINLLKELCLSKETSRSRIRKENLEAEFESVIVFEKTILSKEQRNKKIAHYDLEHMFDMETIMIDLCKVGELVWKLDNLLSLVSECLIGARIQFESITELKNTYTAELMKLYQS